MSETNLKEYSNRIQTLLSQNAADEVIHHCRHILLYYPKNVAVYRFLGRALVIIGRLEEAEAALRRVLSVIPDDFEAYALLGEVYERTQRCDDAIWHLERAFDQKPSDKTIIEALRVLYHRCRQTSQMKVQMTAGAVARQYVRAGDLDRAAEALRTALKNAPDRLDLQTLLAQILWKAGRREDAAEIALEVVEELPDCLAANHILAELWLSYDRPSDAQHYVNRVESVDPYLAVELVQGTLPDDETFRLEELDFHQSAHREAVAARPDWLKDVGEVHPPAEPGSEADEWSSWSSGMLAARSASPRPEPPVDSESAGREEELDWLSSSPLRDQAAQTNPEVISTDDLEALFGEQPDSFAAPPPSTSVPPSVEDDEHPFAWAQRAGLEILDEPEENPQSEFADLFDEASLPTLEQDDNPLAWMNSYDSNLLHEQPEAQGDAAGLDDLFHLTEDRSGFDVYDPYAPPTDEVEEASETTVEELDWLGGADDAAAAPSEFDEFAESVPASPDSASGQGAIRGLTSFLNETNLDWLKADEGDAVVSEEEMDDWLNQFGAPGSQPSSAITDEASTPAWLSALDEPSPSAERSEPAAQVSEEPTFEVEQEELVWMSESERPENETQPEEEGLPDWLTDLNSEAQQGEPTAAGGESEEDAWSGLSEFSASMPEEASSLEGDLPDWLRDSSPLQEIPAAGSPSAEETLDWLTEETLGEAATQVELNGPDALSDEWALESALDTEPAVQAAEAAPSADEALSSEADWLTELTMEGEAGFAAPEPEVSSSLVEAAADADLAWLSELEETAMDAGVQDAAAEMAGAADLIEDQPEWLSEPEPAGIDLAAASATAAPDGPIDEDTFDWLSTLPEAALPSSEEQAAADALAPIPPQPEEPAAETVVPEWLAGLELSNELSARHENIEKLVSESSAIEDYGGVSEDFDWETATADASDADAAFASEMFGADRGAPQGVDDAWATPEPEFEVFDEAAQASGERADEEAEGEFAPQGEQPFEAVAEDAGVDFAVVLEDSEFHEAVEPSPAENAPDWLNAMVPGLDVDYEEQENVLPDEEFEHIVETPLPVDHAVEAETEFSWLERMVDEEMASDSAPVPALPRFVFSRRPTWMRQSPSDDDFPDWVYDESGEN